MRLAGDTRCAEGPTAPGVDFGCLCAADSARCRRRRAGPGASGVRPVRLLRVTGPPIRSNRSGARSSAIGGRRERGLFPAARRAYLAIELFALFGFMAHRAKRTPPPKVETADEHAEDDKQHGADSTRSGFVRRPCGADPMAPPDPMAGLCAANVEDATPSPGGGGMNPIGRGRAGCQNLTFAAAIRSRPLTNAEHHSGLSSRQARLSAAGAEGPRAPRPLRKTASESHAIAARAASWMALGHPQSVERRHAAPHFFARSSTRRYDLSGIPADSSAPVVADSISTTNILCAAARSGPEPLVRERARRYSAWPVPLPRDFVRMRHDEPAHAAARICISIGRPTALRP